ncbi:hypothetical protein LTR17_006152 [Elasticomyces elasticus]|nr:hypothetical protein LTR17_006152 [Elasticomyces elasticus]
MSSTSTDKGWLRDILPELDLKSSISRMTPRALRERIRVARLAGAQMLSVGSKDYSFDMVEDMLDQADTILSSVPDSQTPQQADDMSPIIGKAQVKRGAKGAERASTSGKTKAAGLKRKAPAKQKVTDIAEKRSRMLGDGTFSLSDAIVYTDDEVFEKTRQRLVINNASHGLVRAKTARAEKVSKKGGKGTTTKPAEEEDANKNRSEETLRTNSPNSSRKSMLRMQGTPQSEDLDTEGCFESPQFADKNCTTYFTKRLDILTDRQEDELNGLAKAKRSRFIYHVHSDKGQRHTRGRASDFEIVPAAVVDHKTMYDSIFGFPTLHELIHNFGQRILWIISKADQFTSYTTSLLFAFVHALGRKTRGETGITITVIDTRAAKDAKGEPVAFYDVPKLMKILGVQEWNGWTQMPFNKLGSPWYTHEYVAHGGVKVAPGGYQQVKFDDLVQQGLYDFLPGLFDKGLQHELVKLYHRCLQLRFRWYNPDALAILTMLAQHRTTYFTGKLDRLNEKTRAGSMDATEAAEKLEVITATLAQVKIVPVTPAKEDQAFDLAFLDKAAAFARVLGPGLPTTDSDASDDDEEPAEDPINLQIFLDLVGLSRRKANDPIFSQYISHHFTAHDVQAVVYTGMNTIPSNLPESMQTMQRVREACTAVGLPAPGPNVVTFVDIWFDWNGVWKGDIKKITSLRGKPNKGTPKETLAQPQATPTSSQALPLTDPEDFQAEYDDENEAAYDGDGTANDNIFVMSDVGEEEYMADEE